MWKWNLCEAQEFFTTIDERQRNSKRCWKIYFLSLSSHIWRGNFFIDLSATTRKNSSLRNSLFFMWNRTQIHTRPLNFMITDSLARKNPNFVTWSYHCFLDISILYEFHCSEGDASVRKHLPWSIAIHSRMHVYFYLAKCARVVALLWSLFRL